MKKYIKFSAAAHLTVLILIVILPMMLVPRYKHKMLPIYTVELINPQQLIPKEPTPKPKVEKPVVKPAEKPKKTDSPIKKTTPVSKPVLPKFETPSLEEKLSKKLKDIKELAPDTSFKEASSYTPQLKTTISNISDFPFQWYISFIQGKIDACWRQPQMVIAKQYSSMVTFTILKDGSVKNIKIKRSSGMANFDTSAIQAIEYAKPLPPLPADYKYDYLVVNVEFRLE